MPSTARTKDLAPTIRAAALGEDLVELRVKPSGKTPYRRISVRPVMVKGRRMLQFSRFTEKQDITKNYEGKQAERELDRLLALPFASLVLKSTDEDLQVTLARSGQHVVTRKAVARPAPALEHDRRKKLPLPPGRPDPLLEKLGIMDARGRVFAPMQDKFTQVNEFLKLLDHGLGELGKPVEAESQQLDIVDLGSGSALLTFAVYHYLNDIKGLPARLTGVELSPDLVAKCSAQRDELDYSDLAFERGAIADYQPRKPPDIVLALHACDTATDEALAQALRWGTRLILSAPCCHHELNRQLATPPGLAPIFRHGILKQRLADIVTDSFRAQLLRVHGYRAEVIEFVDSEHTARNLLIRAVKTDKLADEKAAAEYAAFKEFWGVTPHLEKLLEGM
ncbi:MAG: SAM-dependent methyltransferase [Dehalococcoidia bacterium]